jgi:hypothetical protein
VARYQSVSLALTYISRPTANTAVMASRSKANARKMCDALGLEYFKAVDVHHRCRCYGCSFKHKDGWSITFVCHIFLFVASLTERGFLHPGSRQIQHLHQTFAKQDGIQRC